MKIKCTIKGFVIYKNKDDKYYVLCNPQTGEITRIESEKYQDSELMEFPYKLTPEGELKGIVETVKGNVYYIKNSKEYIDLKTLETKNSDEIFKELNAMQYEGIHRWVTVKPILKEFWSPIDGDNNQLLMYLNFSINSIQKEYNRRWEKFLSHHYYNKLIDYNLLKEKVNKEIFK